MERSPTSGLVVAKRAVIAGVAFFVALLATACGAKADLTVPDELVQRVERTHRQQGELIGRHARRLQKTNQDSLRADNKYYRSILTAFILNLPGDDWTDAEAAEIASSLTARAVDDSDSETRTKTLKVLIDSAIIADGKRKGLDQDQVTALIDEFNAGWMDATRGARKLDE